MLGPSLKSVPGCLVSIVPMLIGLPVALTPGLGPQDEVSVEPEPPLEPLAAALEVPPPDGAAPELLLLLLLLPQPAKTTSAIAASSPRTMRIRDTTWLVLTDSPLLICKPSLGILPGVA